MVTLLVCIINKALNDSCNMFVIEVTVPRLKGQRSCINILLVSIQHFLNDFRIGFWNCSDGVVFLVFPFIRIYLILHAQRVSGITSIRYAHGQRLGKLNDIKLFETMDRIVQIGIYLVIVTQTQISKSVHSKQLNSATLCNFHVITMDIKH